jgi:hypothetical protein
MCSLIIIATAFLLAWVSSTKLSTVKQIMGICVVGIVMFGIAWQMPIRMAPTYLSIFPLANIVSHTGVAAEDPYAARLFTINSSGQPTIAYRSSEFANDQFANRWLLQLESTSSEDKIRYWAYFMDSTNQDHLCRALLDWGTKVTIVTNVKDLEKSLSGQCPEAEFSIQK